jgi:UTP--glucose-1-phosphate uridylyltransferase
MARTIGSVPFHGLRFAGTRFDCGSKTGFLEANIAFALERPDLRPEMAGILRRYSGAFSADVEEGS